MKAAISSLVAGLVALAPGPAQAQQAPFATAVFYEIREDIDCNPGNGVAPDCSDVSGHGFGTRIADATLVGQVQGPADSPFHGSTVIEASSIVSKVDWTGPAHGKINVRAGAVHAVFSGQLNLSLAILGGKPLAPISGHWRGTKGTVQAGGNFEGLFLIPFQVPDHPDWGWFYLELDPTTGQPSGGVTPLRPGECRDPDPASAGDYHYGVPMVKLVATFFRQ